MPTIRTKDDIYLDIPEGMAPDAPEVREAVAQERQGRLRRRMQSPEFQAKVEANREEDRKKYDPTVGMDVGDKIRANIGAGMATLGQGVQQIASKVGLAKPVSDEDIHEKRARDETLAEATQTGLGADWMPRTGKMLQFAGEVAPTLAIPGAAFTRAGAMVLPRALLSTAGRRAVAGGAMAGGAQGALMPVAEDESRTLNTVLGSAAGAALPLAVGGYRAARGLLTQRGARARAGEMLGVTEHTPTPAHPDTLVTKGAENVPLSTAAQYGDEVLAGHELASRARGRAAEGWGELGRQQREAVFENVMEGTKRAGTEGERRLARSEGWKADAAKAVKDVDAQAWGQEMANLRGNINTAMRSPQGQNQMRGVLSEIARQMDELGPEFSPMHLAELRAQMAGSVRGSPTNPFVSAPKGDPAFISLRQEFDNILNAATGNRWQKVLEGYTKRSVPVSQAKAETSVQRQFMTPEGTPTVTTSPEGTPIITPTALRRAVTGVEKQNTYGTAPSFAPDSSRVLKGTLEAMERQNVVQRAKATATGGGGSMTTPLAEAIARVDPSRASNWIMKGINFARNMRDQRALQELDQALIDPKRYYDLVLETIASGKALSPGQQAAMQAISSGAGATLPRSLQAAREPQQQQRY